jgi:hypothetical protein
MTEEHEQNQPDEGSSQQNTDEKVVFNQAQQDKVQELINESQARAYAKAQKEAENKISTTVNAEVENRLKEIQANQKKADKDGVINQAQLDETRAQWEAERAEEMAALNSKLNTLASKDKENALLMAIGQHDVYSPAQVMRLIADNVVMGDNGEVSVVDDNGNPKINSDLKPMQLNEFVTSWLADNRNFLKGSGGGAGSEGAMLGENGNFKLKTPQDWRNLSREQQQELIKSGALVADIGGQKMKIKEEGNPFQTARQRKFKSQRERN